MRIYIAGKITGDRQYKRKFKRAEKTLARLGHSVMSPAWLYEYPEFSWEHYMTVTEGMQKVCEAVCFLYDFNRSKGAMIEHDRAKGLGQIIFYGAETVPKAELK